MGRGSLLVPCGRFPVYRPPLSVVFYPISVHNLQVSVYRRAFWVYRNPFPVYRGATSVYRREVSVYRGLHSVYRGRLAPRNLRSRPGCCKIKPRRQGRFALPLRPSSDAVGNASSEVSNR